MNDEKLHEIDHIISHIIKNVKILTICTYFLILSPFLILHTTVYGISSQAEISNPCLFTTAEDYSRSLIMPSTANNTLLNNVVPAVQNNKATFVTHFQVDKVLSMEIALNLRNQAQLEQCLDSINDPASPNYHHFLNDTTISPYLPTPGQKLSIETFLKQHGFNVTNSSSLVLKASAPVNVIENTFGIKINVYQVPIQYREVNYTKSIQGTLPTFYYNGIFHAADSPPQLPSNIASLVSYIGGLDNYTTVTPLQTPCYGPICPKGIQAGYLITNLYDSGFDGSGENVAIVDCAGDPNPQTAIDIYDTQYGLAPTTLKIYYPDGMPSTYDLRWASETMMDIEAVHTVAPGATIDLIYAPCTPGGLLDGIDYVITNHLANIVSNSWSFACGSSACSDTQLSSSLVSSNHNRLALDTTQGLTILFASGDNGATPDGTTLGTEFPASDPNVLAIGATDLYLDGCGTLPCSYNSEVGSKISGGGYSSYFSEPTWQTSALGVKSGRAVPDVSMLGYNPGFWVYSTSSNKCGALTTAAAGWFSCAGTSLSTPLWAGYLAIIEQKKGSSLGNVAPFLYQVYNSTAYLGSFHDITSGDNKYNVIGYQAGVGWDPVTGLGTPIADKLAAIPEFPFAIPILAMSIISLLVFYRMNSKIF